MGPGGVTTPPPMTSLDVAVIAQMSVKDVEKFVKVSVPVPVVKVEFKTSQ